MLKVMIIDDDSMVFRIVKKTIPWEKYNMSVEAYAPNGMKAIEYLTENKMDILFVDLSMPHMGGVELIKRIYEYLPETVFVILSSHSEYRFVKESFCVGAFDYLLKVDIDDEEIVEAMLKRVTDKLHIMGKEEERHFDLGDLISKLNMVSYEKDEYWYKIQALSMKKNINRLKVAESLFRITEGQGAVYGCYDGCIILLHFAKDKNQIDKQILSINENLLNENGDIIGTGESTAGIYRDIESLYFEAVKNIDDGFLRIKEYLKQNYFRQELSLQVVANELNMNKRMVSRYIADYSGLMFKAYLNEIRIRNAQEKLQTTNMRIQEIAYTCGYVNVEHFTRIFTEKTGRSPSQYAVVKKADKME